MLAISRPLDTFVQGAIALLALAMLAAVWAVGTAPAVGREATAALPSTLAVVPAKAKCADLRDVDLSAIGGAGSRVVSATETTSVAGGAICAVSGTLAPTILFHVELPLTSWTQRYLQTGCGGLCGNLRLNIGAADGCPTVTANGFVIASTDMGHEGSGGEFGLDPQKRADFAYRGVHLTAVTAKALIHAFYSQSERYAYFDGCSDGGREALVEAQRFPRDFDGIIAGAPALNFTVQNSFYHGWQARSNTGADGKAILVASRLPILHAAVLEACDALDGQADGLISTPAGCSFDPMRAVCKADQDRATCLTSAEAMVARRFYDGPRDAKTGERLTQGGPQFGSELQWAGVYVPQSPDQPIFSTIIANGAMTNLIFANGRPATTDTLSFDRATFDRLRERHTLFDASSPDLAAFAGRGGKLILFHGWADPHISPINTIAYHAAVRRQMGVDQAEKFERLYLMPGMGHCSGGEGPSKFDLLTPMMAWVEQHQAPDAIMTRMPAPDEHSAVGAARSRPVYPYPYVAAYVGRGDVNVGANWRRGKASPSMVPAWTGSDYFTPYVGITG